MTKYGKTHLVKARVAQRIKDAVVAAAAARGASGEAEAVIVREALEEYLHRHGWLKIASPMPLLRVAEDPPAGGPSPPQRQGHGRK